jgi:hypothetical protein
MQLFKNIINELLSNDKVTNLEVEVMETKILIKISKQIPSILNAKEEYVINFGDRGDRDGYKRT